MLASRINSTAINVTWDKQTLVEVKGFANYIVEYRQVDQNKKRQSGDRVTVPWPATYVIISNLNPGGQYGVSVSVSTSVGISGMTMMINKAFNDYRSLCMYNISLIF